MIKRSTYFNINKIELITTLKSTKLIYDYIVDNYSTIFIFNNNIQNHIFLFLKEEYSLSTIRQDITRLKQSNVLIRITTIHCVTKIRSERKYIKDERSKILKKYNLNKIEYDNLVESSNDSCSICNTHVSNLNKKLSIDHYHKSGKVRGLLCTNCNLALGLFKDNINFIKEAINYLISFQSSISSSISSSSIFTLKLIFK